MDNNAEKVEFVTWAALVLVFAVGIVGNCNAIQGDRDAKRLDVIETRIAVPSAVPTPTLIATEVAK